MSGVILLKSSSGVSGKRRREITEERGFLGAPQVGPGACQGIAVMPIQLHNAALSRPENQAGVLLERTKTQRKGEWDQKNNIEAPDLQPW